ncbi:serine hydrolase domain-containing protein [Nodosilinea sp. AN01ver1]|uniref:serine hydrolase domain-containing protein n=1 Tax=Nodosilinea sp. AN01ver1 TaxID=3423362 RepID=UPI003D322D14
MGFLLAMLLTVAALAKPAGVVPPSIEAEPALDLGGASAPASPTAPGLGDRRELSDFIDGLFDQELATQTAPGAAVAVVKDGELFFAKGYGYADLERQIPVDADKTLFRVASISKLFTATATMQLQEQKLLDLDDTVNRYLGDQVQLENPFDEPVTFAQLLTHTDGSTKRRIGLAARTEAELQPLQTYLSNHLPPIVYPPGELFSYSSHSIALLGYLVERIAGQPFVDYVNEHILQPLAMNRSSFAQPPPHVDDLATGYQKQGGQFKPVPYLYLNIGPAAALSATATDMAHFMIAQLQGGQYQNNRILQPESVAAMQRIHFRSHPQLPGTGYGFRERRVNGLSTVGHLGSLRGYSSSLTLMPDQNIGIFIVSNSFSGVHSRVLKQFFDRYFPPPVDGTAADLPAVDPAEVDLSRFVGTYRDLEYPRHTLVKLSAPLSHIVIRQSQSGLNIQTPSLFFRYPMPNSQLEPVGPLLFRHRDDGTLTAFEADDEGHIVYAYNPIFAKMATFSKIAWYENLWLHAAVVVAAAFLFLSGLWVWPLRPLWRRLRNRAGHTGPPTPLVWRMAGGVSMLNLIFVIGFPLSLWLYGGWKLAYGMPWFGFALLTLPIVATVLTVAMVAIAIWVYGQKEWSWARRAHYSLLTLAAVGFAVLMGYWNILGYQV